MRHALWLMHLQVARPLPLLPPRLPLRLAAVTDCRPLLAACLT